MKAAVRLGNSSEYSWSSLSSVMLSSANSVFAVPQQNIRTDRHTGKLHISDVHTLQCLWNNATAE